MRRHRRSHRPRPRHRARRCPTPCEAPDQRRSSSTSSGRRSRSSRSCSAARPTTPSTPNTTPWTVSALLAPPLPCQCIKAYTQTLLLVLAACAVSLTVELRAHDDVTYVHFTRRSGDRLTFQTLVDSLVASMNLL